MTVIFLQLVNVIKKLKINLTKILHGRLRLQIPYHLMSYLFGFLSQAVTSVTIPSIKPKNRKFWSYNYFLIYTYKYSIPRRSPNTTRTQATFKILTPYFSACFASDGAYKQFLQVAFHKVKKWLWLHHTITDRGPIHTHWHKVQVSRVKRVFL